jgi:prolyl-tRNA editing enzyme YbaK/EbsC (Cys-tRNA(Pro) deacylase)
VSRILAGLDGAGGNVKGSLGVHRELLAQSVPHEVVHLPHVVTAADEVPAALGLPRQTCLVIRLFVCPGGPLVAAAVPAGDWPDPALLSAALLARRLPATGLRPASPDEVSSATDFASALVSPVGLPADVVLLVDTALLARPVLYAPTGEGGTVLGIRVADLLAVTGGQVSALTRPVRPVPVQPGREPAAV